MARATAGEFAGTATSSRSLFCFCFLAGTATSSGRVCLLLLFAGTATSSARVCLFVCLFSFILFYFGGGGDCNLLSPRCSRTQKVPKVGELRTLSGDIHAFLLLLLLLLLLFLLYCRAREKEKAGTPTGEPYLVLTLRRSASSSYYYYSLRHLFPSRSFRRRFFDHPLATHSKTKRH